MLNDLRDKCSERSLYTIYSLILLVCVLAVFYPVCSFEFLNYDDNFNVYTNERITNFSCANLWYFWTHFYENLYIPLTYTLWGMLSKLSFLLPATHNTNLHPALYHGMNLLLHGVNVLLLFRILRLLLNSDCAAAVGALLFAVHPVQVEAVAWVTGAKDLLCGFFSLLALWLYLTYAEAEPKQLPWRDRRYNLATMCLLAAVLAKPIAVTVPMVAALLGCFRSPRPARRMAIELLPWILLTLPVILITKFAQPETHHEFLPVLWQRFLVAGDAITFYLGKILLPVNLGPDYGRTPQFVLAKGWVYGTGLLPYLLVVFTFWKRRKPSLLVVGGAFIVSLIPVLGFVPFDFQNNSTVADRYLYMAMLGPALALGWLWSRLNKIPAAHLLLVTLLVVLGAKSAAQVRLWHDSLTLNTHMVEVNPRSSIGYNNIGLVWQEANHLDEAIAAFHKTIAIAPQTPRGFVAYLYLGLIYEMKLMPERFKEYYLKALQVNPDGAAALAPYFTKHGDTARTSGEWAIALSYYQLAIAAQPDSATQYFNLGLTYKELNNRPEAISAYQKALELQPDLGEAANNLGYLYLEMHRDQEAIPLFQRAIITFPDVPVLYNNLGRAHVNLGLLSEAVTYFEKAIEVDPTYVPALNNLSTIELQLGNTQYAHDLAEKAKALGDKIIK